MVVKKKYACSGFQTAGRSKASSLSWNFWEMSSNVISLVLTLNIFQWDWRGSHSCIRWIMSLRECKMSSWSSHMTLLPRINFMHKTSRISGFMCAKHTPQLCINTLKILIPFSTTYLCESGFSTIKPKQLKRLEVECDMRCAFFTTAPDIKALISNKQFQPSHWVLLLRGIEKWREK